MKKKREYSPTRPSGISCLILIGLVIGYYLMDNLSLFSFLDYKLYNGIIKSGYWCTVILIAWRYPRVRPKSRLRLRDNIYFRAIIYASIYVVLWFGAGVADGFGKNPYDLSFYGIIINLIVFGTMLMAKELIRSHLVNSAAQKESYLLFMLIAFFFTVMSYNLNQYIGFKSLEDGVKFLAEFFVPEFSKNLMATYLAFVGGPVASLCYVGIINAANYFFPILPDLKWITGAFIGIMCPVFSLLEMQNFYQKHQKINRKSITEKGTSLSWIITCVFSIGMVWFAVGVFPVYPSVIATGSMEPLIMPGDMILVEKILKEEDIGLLKEGDIIQFKRENILISHRIVEIVEEQNAKSFRTKGDNNSAVDAMLVKPEFIKGKVTFVVPKIGWPTLLLKREQNERLFDGSN